MDGDARSGGPQPLSKAIAQVVALRGIAQSGGILQLASAWKVAAREIAGEPAAAGSRATAVNRGALQIAVNNSALLNELVSFHKPSLLQLLKERFPDLRIRDLRFRLKDDSPSH